MKKEYKAQKLLLESMEGLANVALFRDDRLIGLYNPSIMKEALQKNNQDQMLSAIYGAVSWRANHTYGVNETTGIAGSHGFGPILYLAAMSVSPSGLIPNRVKNEMGENAKKIWDEFANGKGKNLVYMEPLSTQTQTHEETYLNFKYKLKVPLIGFSEAERRNRLVLGFDPSKTKWNILASIFDGYLKQELDKIVPYPSIEDLYSKK